MKLAHLIIGLSAALVMMVSVSVPQRFGGGFYVPAVALTVFLLITLIFVAAFQRRFLPKSMLKNIVVYTGSKKVRVGDLQAILDGLKLRTRSSSIQHSTQKQASQYRLMTYIPQELDYEDLYNALSEVKGVYKIIIEDV